MRLAMKAAFLAVGVVGVQLTLAIPSVADPSGDRCAIAVSLFCQFVPTAPDLEGFVDLTTQQPPAPSAPPPESLPPADVCAAGCI
jgi:hypothetical protein